VLVARVNALQGLAQITKLRAGSKDLEQVLLALIQDPESEIRAQAAAASGMLQSSPEQVAKFLALIRDPNPRVQFHAAMAAAKRKDSSAAPALLEVLRGSDDAYLRHGVIYALACAADETMLKAAAKDSSASVRMGALLALRRKGSRSVELFLQDPEPKIVLEAARAINDVPIAGSMPQLARLMDRNISSELDVFTVRRALNAGFRLGAAEHAKGLADFATRPSNPEALRVEALGMLGDWKQPKGRDKIMGLWRPLPARDGHVAARALEPSIKALMKSGSEALQLATIRAAAQLGIDFDFLGTIADATEPVPVRVEALKELVERKDARLPEAIKLALASKEGPLRVEATRLQPEAHDNTDTLSSALKNGSIPEKQAVIAGLATDPKDTAVQALVPLLNDLVSGKLAPALRLDVLEAAKKRSEPTIKELLAKYESNRPQTNSLAAYDELLYGGNAEEGKKTFIERQDVACFRCHKVNGEGGEVGPELTGIGKRQSREYILESILYPNRQIAAGFESVIVNLKNGTAYAGLLKKETDSELEINSPEDGMLKVKKADIKSRDRGLSPMPEELVNLLTKQEIRSLVEYLSSLK
jgi:quinoprotein glucose dehydrogenase